MLLFFLFKFPSTKEEWNEVAKGFEKKWQIPNCGGAMDGKHIRIWAPPTDWGSILQLQALVNANYEFIFVDAGKNWRISDGGILQHTAIYQLLIEGKLMLPERHKCKANLNFVFIGDEAFALHKHVLQPLFLYETLTTKTASTTTEYQEAVMSLKMFLVLQQQNFVCYIRL